MTNEEVMHPLFSKLMNVGKLAVENKGLRALARAQHGIEMRNKWIAQRQSQIDMLIELQKEVLAAYDAGDSTEMNRVLHEIERISSSREGTSEAELRIREVTQDDEGEAIDCEVAQRVFNPKKSRYYDDQHQK